MVANATLEAPNYEIMWTYIKNNNQLYYVVFNDIDDKQYIVLNKNGTKFIEENITTDLKVTYNDDGSVLIGEIQTNIDNKTNENTNNEEEINSNLNIPRAIKNH